MPQYRKLPVVIEAYQTDEPLDIPTLEGVMHANAGDWIITGVSGETYPCKPDIFAKTYEPADATPDPLTRLAAAAERIAAALEREPEALIPLESVVDDPDAYEYREVSVGKINAMRADGYRLYKVVQYAADDGSEAEPVYIMRRQRDYVA